MTLDTSRWIVRYYLWTIKVLGTPYDVEDRLERGTNLCAFVRRIFFCTLLIVGVPLICLFLFALLAVIAFAEPRQFFIGLGAALGLIGFILFFPLGVSRLLRRKWKPDNIAVAYVKAIKQGICPLIQFAPRKH